MASDMRAIERWWQKQRKAPPVGAAPRIDALLDRAARELGLHSAFDRGVRSM